MCDLGCLSNLVSRLLGGYVYADVGGPFTQAGGSMCALYLSWWIYVQCGCTLRGGRGTKGGIAIMGPITRLRCVH